MPMIIEEADNGWVIHYPSHNTEGTTTEVIEYPEDKDEGDKSYEEAVQKLLNRVMDGLCIFGSKHNDYRTFVEVVKQNGD